MLRNGQWQTVCDDGWDLNEGSLVCRLLGYGTVIRVYSGAHFGEGAGNIYETEWECTGRENSLEECPRGFTLIGCSDSEAAGVSCSPPITTTTPTSDTTQPTQRTTQPTQSTTQPTRGTTQPTQSTTQPTQSTTQPTQTTTQPTQGTTQPTQSTTQPTQGTTQPTQGTTPSNRTTSPSDTSSDVPETPVFVWYIVGAILGPLVVCCMVGTICWICYNKVVKECRRL